MMNTAFYENTIFAGLPPGDLAKWDIPVIEHRLNPSAVVLEQGEPDRGLFLIGSGSVALSRKLPCGHGQALEIVGEGGGVWRHGIFGWTAPTGESRGREGACGHLGNSTRRSGSHA